MSEKVSRTKNLMLNVGIGYLAQIIILILQFVGRRIFLANLSVEYLGISGLFANILSVLSLAELGADSAFAYALYKPLSEKDAPKVHSLLVYFRRFYIWITIAVYACGLALVPVLRFIINFDLTVGITIQDYTIYYILYLTNSALTYLAAHCTTLLKANQDDRIVRLLSLLTTIAMQIAQMIALYLWRNFTLYVLIMLITTLVHAIVVVLVTRKRYSSYFKSQESVTIDKEGINKKVISTFLYKIGAVLVNNVDNILISILVGTAAVGLYSNYWTVISAAQGMISILSVSLLSGLGNLYTTREVDNQKSVFSIQLLLYHFVAAVGGIGFGLLLNEFVALWIGKEYCMHNSTVVILAINFYLINSTAPIWMVREANGLFEQVKYLMFIRAGVNLLLSCILGVRWGVLGILIATAISIITTNFWYEPGLIFKTVFHSHAWFYWKQQIRYFVSSLIALGICVFVLNAIPDGWGGFALKGCTVVVAVMASFCCVNWRTDAMQCARKFVAGILNSHQSIQGRQKNEK